MKLLFLFSLSILLAGDLLAQNDTLEYFLHEDGRKISNDKDGGYYFRQQYKVSGDDRWHVKDYFVKQRTLYRSAIYIDDSLSVPDGVATEFHKNRNLRSKIRYVKGKIEGLVKEYDSSARLVDSAYYLHGIPQKVHYSWYRSGKVKFRGEYDNEGLGIGTEHAFFEDGSVKSYGKTISGYLKDSLWQYHHSNGQVAFNAYWDKGALVKTECFDEAGKRLNTCDTAKMPEFPGEISNYLMRALHMPEEISQKYDFYDCRVCVIFLVLEDGQIEVKEMYGNCLEAAGLEALRVVKAMPRWKPGKYYNQPVDVYYTLPISFRIN